MTEFLAELLEFGYEDDWLDVDYAISRRHKSENKYILKISYLAKKEEIYSLTYIEYDDSKPDDDGFNHNNKSHYLEGIKNIEEYVELWRK